MREIILPARPWRGACGYCGARTITTVGYAIAGNCSNCGSYEVVPLTAGQPPARGAPR